jgi:pyruvate dehydrogenase E2 component (dihydrolipoamide acetyltransferase)
VGITIDHRLINGVGGAEFLNAIKNELEAVLDWAK